MRSLNTPIIKFTLVMLSGVIVGFYIKPTADLAFVFLGIALLLFLIFYYRAKKQLFEDHFFGMVVWIMFFVLGLFTATIHLPQNQTGHYLNQISAEGVSEKAVLQVRIREVLKPDLFNKKFIAEVETTNNKPSHGKILVLYPKDSGEAEFSVGDRMIIASELKKIPSPLNPHQFDYSRFMGIRGIERQLNLQNASFRQLNSQEGLLSEADLMRQNISRDLQANGFKKEELSIIQALLLGQKQDISPETYNNYAAAGAIHILAVSGLHVGILLLILNRIFSPFDRSKKGKVVKAFLIILLLWGFAVLAGLSPSVVRAVTMFSFLSIGMQLKRRSSSVNSLFLSLMLLVLIHPQWIFEVGFQLSYAAVLSILLIQPLLYSLWKPQNRLLKYLWQLLSTTIAAQAGVLPLSLFYFHQFPGLFFLSNLLILPFLGLILGTGILVIILASLNLLPELLTSIFSGVIRLLNSFVAEIAKQEKFLFSDIPFSFSQVWIFYLLLLLLILLAYSFTFRKLVVVLITIILVQLVFLSEPSKADEKLLVFHRSGKTIIGQQFQQKLKLYNNSEEIRQLPLIKNYKVGAEIEETEILPSRNIFSIKDDYLLVIDSTGIYPQKGNPRYLLLSGSPKINLERVIEELNPEWIVADGNNYRFLIDKWRQTAEKKEIPFHHTGEKGAFKIE
ncbi:ComEC/Rec2 family competence protein [Salinimicrobium catena]|uniref:ComEC/Rec2 family competence protein n=1 Tax=Salinimicrobium catena TaxID=390640 RepID=UPI002FE435BD